MQKPGDADERKTMEQVALAQQMNDHETLMALAAERFAKQKSEKRLLRRCQRAVGDYAAGTQKLLKVFRGQCILFDHKSRLIFWWSALCCIAAIYTVIFAPLSLILPESRWRYHREIDALIDALFVVDVFVRSRTTVRDHGYDVVNARAILLHYFRGWFALDAISSVPERGTRN